MCSCRQRRIASGGLHACIRRDSRTCFAGVMMHPILRIACWTDAPPCLSPCTSCAVAALRLLGCCYDGLLSSHLHGSTCARQRHVLRVCRGCCRHALGSGNGNVCASAEDGRVAGASAPEVVYVLYIVRRVSYYPTIVVMAHVPFATLYRRRRYIYRRRRNASRYIMAGISTMQHSRHSRLSETTETTAECPSSP